MLLFWLIAFASAYFSRLYLSDPYRYPISIGGMIVAGYFILVDIFLGGQTNPGCGGSLVCQENGWSENRASNEGGCFAKCCGNITSPFNDCKYLGGYDNGFNWNDPAITDVGVYNVLYDDLAVCQQKAQMLGLPASACMEVNFTPPEVVNEGEATGYLLRYCNPERSIVCPWPNFYCPLPNKDGKMGYCVSDPSQCTAQSQATYQQDDPLGLLSRAQTLNYGNGCQSFSNNWNDTPLSVEQLEQINLSYPTAISNFYMTGAMYEDMKQCGQDNSSYGCGFFLSYIDGRSGNFSNQDCFDNYRPCNTDASKQELFVVVNQNVGSTTAAQNVAKSFNARLATYTDLVYAYNKGAQFCKQSIIDNFETVAVNFEQVPLTYWIMQFDGFTSEQCGGTKGIVEYALSDSNPGVACFGVKPLETDPKSVNILPFAAPVNDNDPTIKKWSVFDS